MWRGAAHLTGTRDGAVSVGQGPPHHLLLCRQQVVPVVVEGTEHMQPGSRQSSAVPPLAVPFPHPSLQHHLLPLAGGAGSEACAARGQQGAAGEVQPEGDVREGWDLADVGGYGICVGAHCVIGAAPVAAGTILRAGAGFGKAAISHWTSAAPLGALHGNALLAGGRPLIPTAVGSQPLWACSEQVLLLVAGTGAPA